MLILDDYYTPQDTASALAKWLIRTGAETILEPSAGEGALIFSCLRQGRQLTSDRSLNILAFDVDYGAVSALAKENIASLYLYHRDFLEVDPGEYLEVDAVVANPPFTRNHKIEKGKRDFLRNKFGIKGAVGIWAHFFLHSLSFLKSGGRIACIVPRSILFTDHGKIFLKKVCDFFSNVSVCEFSDKPVWSKFAQESGAVILADGYKQGCAPNYKLGLIGSCGSIKYGKRPVSRYYENFENISLRLGDISKISIGIVTGKNSVFLLTQDEVERNKISASDVLPIISKSKHAAGIKVSRDEVVRLSQKGEKTWLLHPLKEKHEILDYLLSRITEYELANTVWFKKRNPWWKVQLTDRCDAILTYMNHINPRVVMLEPGIYCTNTLHKITFNKNVSDSLKKASLLTPISTFGQLWSELNGRIYGGGVLKLEISDARRIPVIEGLGAIPQEIFEKIDIMIKRGEEELARNIVDKILFSKVFGAECELALDELRAELNYYRELRRVRNGKNKFSS